jgi:hypothetical protein
LGVNADDPLAAQRRYARWLLATTRLGAVVLVVTFTIYVAGWVAPHVPIDRLPSLWSLPASEFLRQTGMPPGWRGWAAHILQGDMLVLGAIAMLISSSILCLAAAAPLFWRRGERWLVMLCVLQIAVLALAASGLLR